MKSLAQLIKDVHNVSVGEQEHPAVHELKRRIMQIEEARYNKVPYPFSITYAYHEPDIGKYLVTIKHGASKRTYYYTDTVANAEDSVAQTIQELDWDNLIYDARCAVEEHARELKDAQAFLAILLRAQPVADDVGE